jgi:hypothetical protein
MIVLSGTVRVTAEKEDAELSAGDALIVPANAIHQIGTIGETEAEWLLAAPAGVRFLFADGREASPSLGRNDGPRLNGNHFTRLGDTPPSLGV